MFCPSCGKEVRQGSKFCGKCGFDLREPEEDTVNVAATSAAANAQPVPRQAQNPAPMQTQTAQTPRKRFGKEEQPCSICNKNLTFTTLRDGYICSSCQSKTLITDPTVFAGRAFSDLTIAKVKELMEAQKDFDKRKQKFRASDSVDSFFSIDKTNQMFECWCNNSAVCMSWDELVSFQLLEDGKVVNKRGVGGAVVGGMLLGGTGAVIGHAAGSKSKEKATQIAVKIVTRNEYYPQIVIDLISSNVKKGSRAYRNAQEDAQRILSMLTIIADAVQSKQSEMAGLSPAEEIKKYKTLLDEGIISQEEFDTKKNQLMGL